MILVYCYAYSFPYVLNKRIVALVISKLWGVLLYCIRLGIQVFRLFQRHLLSPQNDIPTPSHSSNQFCGDAACLENEINILVLNISRYYICSWYNKISPNEEFTTFLNSSIHQTLINLCSSISNVDKKKFSYVILQIYLNFFSHIIEAKKKSGDFKKENFEMKHWALKDNLAEWCYLQSLISALLDSFCPPETDRSLRSKHSPLLHTLVVEILTQNVIHPLVNVLCNPSFLNKMLLKIMLNCVKKNQEMNISSANENLHVNNNPISEEHVVSQPVILLTNEDLPHDQVFQNFNETETSNRLSVPDESCQIKYNHGFLMKKLNYEKASEDFPCFVSSGIKSSSNINLSNHDCTNSQIQEYNSCVSTAYETTIKRSRSADYIRQMPQLKALNEKDYNIILQSENNKLFVALKSDINSSNSIEQAEEAVEVEVPTLFTDVQIVDTCQQNEAGLLPYTLYCIQYTGIFHDTAKSPDIPHFVKQVVSIKRRFREFVTLQSKLEDNPSLKVHLKGIKGPSKWLVLPFSNLDKKNIAERRLFLENYLKELCSSAAIAQSSELQEFLAYGGEESMTFVRKAADASVPRIDKMLVRGVKGAFDIFRTALPNSPLDEENTPRLSFEDTLSDYRFQEHLLDYSSHEPEIKEHITECCQCSVLNANNFLHEETPLGNTIVDLIGTAFQLDETSLGYLFSVFKILCAPCINRFLVDTLGDISEEHLAYVLHLLHKLLWPDNKGLSEQDASFGSESIPDMIMECFDDLLSGKHIVPSLKAIVLAKIKLFISSFQHEEANRCLLFHMFDVVIETLCSEVT
ncbi:sorting nexin-19 [Caerostris extrusa]|uniref:Sorting nexin-19 n=1 Tax=Caerostris extrusa TaxID=172846 RepID=A0AAV4XL77_CAEEX|nr:sorting nexin-19 [Caerostris extrusa]